MIVGSCLALASCQPQTGYTGFNGGSGLTALDISVPTRIEPSAGPIVVHVAKNAWADVALRANLDASSHPVLALPAFPDVTIRAYQILPAAVNLDTAEYVRQTGESASIRDVPRVLLPLKVNGGIVDLSAARDPAHPADRSAHPVNQPVLIYLELHSTSEAKSGLHTGTLQLLNAPDGRRAGEVNLQLAVDDIELPKAPALTIAAPLDWTDLAALYPDTFEGVTPRLLRRGDPQHAALIDLLGQFVSLAHENQVSAYVPRLQPIVKWPPGEAARAEWDDFDSIVAPWLGGDGFRDGQPTRFWPLPEPDSLAGFDPGSRNQYWRLATGHFAQHRWLSQAMIALRNDSPAGPESTILSSKARQLLLADPRIRVLLPLRGDMTEFSSAANTDVVPAAAAGRLFAESPGLVAPSPVHDWPADLKHWIDADPKHGTMSYLGVGNEQDIRTLAALAFLRNASVIQLGCPLPRPDGPADAGQVIWFYPGRAYGVDFPLPTLQLKWLRHAVQDFALFHAVKPSDQALKMCRLITRPVNLLPAQLPSPLDTILAGTNDPHASGHARRLIVSTLGSDKTAEPTTAGQPVDTDAVRWFTDHQRPTLIPRAVRWMWPDAIDQPDGQEPGHWIDAAVSVDIYNPAEEMPNGNQLQWASVPAGWEVHPQPVQVPSLAQFQVHRVVTHARFNLDRVSAESRQPLQLTFIDGFNGQPTPFSLMLPVTVSERRQHHLSIDGSLGDWDADDALQLDRPLIRMIDRPALRSQAISNAATNSSIYSAWSDENFYLAFRLAGVTSSDLSAVHNFVDYQAGRAWGEDLCELLIQPLYADNVIGPTLHLVCKPGGEWVEQKSQPGPDGKWEPFEAAGVRYASGVDVPDKVWRGELAIPWQAIAATGRSRPGLLRFNFIQHKKSTGESASWAGPVDQSRDETLSGLVLLRDPDSGLANTARR